jgi:hypothetical protein
LIRNIARKLELHLSNTLVQSSTTPPQCVDKHIRHEIITTLCMEIGALGSIFVVQKSFLRPPLICFTTSSLDQKLSVTDQSRNDHLVTTAIAEPILSTEQKGPFFTPTTPQRSNISFYGHLLFFFYYHQVWIRTHQSRGIQISLLL